MRSVVSLGRPHWGLILLGLLAVTFVLGVGSTRGAAASCPSGASLYVMAHPDDDLLFASPDLLHEIQSGRCVRTVYLTAGERDHDLDYLNQRELGIRAAYSRMAGVANSWTTADAGISGHPMPLLTLAGRPTVSVVFMRLPEGFWGGGGTTRDETLKNLWQGTVSLMHAEDGSSAYSSSSLTSTLTALMAAYQPDTVRTQDYVGTFGDGDHDDHHAAAYFARRAHQAYSTAHTFVGYQDYETENRAQNVFDPDLTAKKNAFDAYLAFDSQPCGSPPNCGTNEYSLWLKRQYTVGSESGGSSDTTAPTVAVVSPANGATSGTVASISASFSEPVDPATVTTSTFTLWTQSGTPVAATVSASGSTATLTPTSALAASTNYTATLKGGAGGISDVSGNTLASDFSWTFSTDAGDTTAPSVSSVTPASGATGVALSTSVTATFSEAVQPATVSTTTFALRDAGGAAVSATVSVNGATATLRPDAALAASATYTATLSGGASGIQDLSGNALPGDYSWSFTTGTPPPCPCSLWPASATPQTAAVADGTAYELGVRFTSDVAGAVTGIRFYKGSGNTGTHVGHLWTSSGTLLATATFANETASGWQQVSFGTPISISANTTYVASYYAPAGHFSLDRPYFTTARDNTPLHAPADSAAAPNGLYREGTGFPTTGFQASNYWVDVVFASDSGPGPDGTPPTSTVSFPAAAGTYGSTTWSAGCGGGGFCGTAADTGSGVKKVELSLRQGNGNYWDGSGFTSAAETFVTASGTTAWSYGMPVTSFPADGQYTLRVRATDVAGNVEAASTRTFTVDTAAPSASAAFPVAGGTYNATTWRSGCATAGFCGSGADVGSGLQRVELSIRRGSGNYWNGSSFGSAAETWVTAAGTSSWSLAFANTSFPAAGSYTVRVRGTDGAGNVGTPAAVTFVYDGTNPTSAVTFPAASGSYNTISWNAGCPLPGICGTAADVGAGVQKVEISLRRGASGNYWNGASFGSATEVFLLANGTTSWSFAFSAASFPAKATYRLRVRATDAAGNVQSPSTRSFTFTP